MRSPVLPGYSWDPRVGSLAEVSVRFDHVYVFCSSGTVTVNITHRGIREGFVLNSGSNAVLDLPVFNGSTFEVSGTGTWNGYLAGAY